MTGGGIGYVLRYVETWALISQVWLQYFFAGGDTGSWMFW